MKPTMYNALCDVDAQRLGELAYAVACAYNPEDGMSPELAAAVEELRELLGFDEDEDSEEEDLIRVGDTVTFEYVRAVIRAVVVEDLCVSDHNRWRVRTKDGDTFCRDECFLTKVRQ